MSAYSKNKTNKSKKGKKNESKQKQNEEAPFSGMTLAIGEFDLIMEITFDDKDLEKSDGKNNEQKGEENANDDKYYKIEEMTSIDKLKFLEEKPEEFLNTIKIRPNNEFIKQLILGNKISKKKCFIDLICYDRPTFQGEEEFFDNIFNYVTTKNYLQINKTPLKEGSRYSLIIELRHKEKKAKKEEEDAAKKEEEQKKKDENEEKEKKEMEERKEQKIKEYREKRGKDTGNKEETAKKEEIKENNEENNEEQQQKQENENDNINNNNEGEQNDNNNNNAEGNEQGGEEKKEENKNEEQQEEGPEDYEKTEAMEAKKIPKFSRQNVLCNLNPSCTKYNLIYLNYDLLSKMPGDYKPKYLIELLEHFKKKKSIIFINFYKGEPNLEEREKEEKAKMEEQEKEDRKRAEEAKIEEEKNAKRDEELNSLEEKKYTLLERKKDLIEVKEMSSEAKKEELNNIKMELEQIEDQEQDIKDEIRAEEEVKKEFKRKKDKEQKKEEKKQEEKDKKEMRELNEIFYYTDGYFFDTKQACALFNKHYLCHTTDNLKTKKVINKQKVFDYFITAIARGAMDEVVGNKVGLFMEDFNRYAIINCSKKTASRKEVNAQPHPKINTHNIEIIKKYQDILKDNKNDYYSIFVSLAAHEISANNSVSNEIIYPTFLTSLEIIKRKVEYTKNGITSINEDQLYKVKINERALQQELKKIVSDTKEGGFVLDCTNKSKSTLKDYVALYDYHLRGFFSSELIRKNLKEKGFIDSKGFIMYDPMYRNVMGAQCKNTKKYEGEELKQKIISNIKGIDVPTRFGDKEVDAKKAIDKQNVPIDKKLPFIKDNYPFAKKTKKRRKRNQDGSSSSEGNSSSDEGKTKEENSNSNNSNSEPENINQ